MPSPTSSNALADKLWIAGLAVGLPLLAMMLLGLDANWDLRNYHLYNPHAWLTGRMATDIAAAQVQTWHNPLLDVPLYLIVSSGMSTRWAGAWLTLPCMAAIFFLLRLQGELSPATPSRASQCVLALLAVTGAATFSTLALSMNDAFVAAAILGSVLLVVGDARDRPDYRAWLWAGVVAGAITGLKLTAIFYCVGLAVATLAGGRWSEKLRRTGALALGGAFGFLLTYGYWGWHLFATYRNPFFPYYNNIFHSPDALPDTWADARFRPDAPIDAVLAPIHLLQRSGRFSEILLSDPRLLIGLLGLLALALLHWKRHSAARNQFAVLLVFFLASFVLWIVQYGIYRYAIVLELLGCLALVLLLQRLPRGRNVALLAAALLVTADTRRPDWGRVHSTSSWLGVRSVPVPADSLVLLASGEPLAYLALGLPASVPLLGLSNNMMTPERCAGLQIRAGQRIARHPGPIWLLSSDPTAGEQAQALLGRHYGLRRSGPCMPFTSTLDDARLCPQQRQAASAIACPAP